MSDDAHGIRTGHEAYAFVCLTCGHGWEQSYDIEHHIDGKGREFVVYVVDGTHVPSPLTRPGCTGCGSRVVRVLGAGRVSSAQGALRRRTAPPEVPGPQASGVRKAARTRTEEAGSGRRRRRPHLLGLLHLFHRKHAGRAY